MRAQRTQVVLKGCATVLKSPQKSEKMHWDGAANVWSWNIWWFGGCTAAALEYAQMVNACLDAWADTDWTNTCQVLLPPPPVVLPNQRAPLLQSAGFMSDKVHKAHTAWADVEARSNRPSSPVSDQYLLPGSISCICSPVPPPLLRCAEPLPAGQWVVHLQQSSEQTSGWTHQTNPVAVGPNPSHQSKSYKKSFLAN